MVRKTYESIGDVDTSELENKLNKAITASSSKPSPTPEETSPHREREQVIAKKSEASSSYAKEKMEAQQRYGLKEITYGTTAHLSFDDDLALTIIAKKRGKDKKEMAAEYVLQGLDKDKQKIGIFEHKK